MESLHNSTTQKLRRNLLFVHHMQGHAKVDGQERRRELKVGWKLLWRKNESS
jgi:hypothetical protein